MGYAAGVSDYDYLRPLANGTICTGFIIGALRRFAEGKYDIGDIRSALMRGLRREQTVYESFDESTEGQWSAHAHSIALQNDSLSSGERVVVGGVIIPGRENPMDVRLTGPADSDMAQVKEYLGAVGDLFDSIDEARPLKAGTRKVLNRYHGVPSPKKVPA